MEGNDSFLTLSTLPYASLTFNFNSEPECEDSRFDSVELTFYSSMIRDSRKSIFACQIWLDDLNPMYFVLSRASTASEGPETNQSS